MLRSAHGSGSRTSTCLFSCFACSASVGDIVLKGADLILAGKDMEVVGNLECSDQDCPDSWTAQATLYQVEEQQMCPAAGEAPSTTTEPTTTTTSTSTSTSTSTEQIGTTQLHDMLGGTMIFAGRDTCSASFSPLSLSNHIIGMLCGRVGTLLTISPRNQDRSAWLRANQNRSNKALSVSKGVQLVLSLTGLR